MSNRDASSPEQPSVGVAVLIMHEHKLLLGKRLKPPMQHSWQLPGGWLRGAESPPQAAMRNIAGFTNLHYDKLEFVTYTDNQFADGLHSVSLYFQTNCLNPATVRLSNAQCNDWYWADWFDLPEPLFLPLRILKQSGYKPF
ncbi:MAG: NUDIX domain-containing protein [Gammaproteobacteria bacterium]|nr:NUDIX domain-containing protein [Gammaproteobacteria bacterium]